MAEVAYIVLGWLLGILAPAIVERIRRSHRSKELIAVVLTELQELQVTLATVALYIRERDGSVTDEFLSWFEKTVRHPPGRQLDPTIEETLSRLRNVSEAERRQIHALLHDPQRGLDLREYKLPFLDSLVSEISICPLGFQAEVWRIIGQLSFFNQQASYLRTQFDKTFDAGISEESRIAILRNINEGYQAVGRRAKSIAVDVSDLSSRWG